MILLVVLLVSTARANRPTSSVHNLSDWAHYFDSLSHSQNQQQINREFNLLLAKLTPKESDTTIPATLGALQKIRLYMPTEIRWLLSAIEIEHGLENEATLLDAKSALESLQISESFNLWGFKSKLSLILRYKKNNFQGKLISAQLELPSLSKIFYLFRMWNRIAQFKVPGVNNELLESRRITWLTAVCQDSDYVLSNFAGFRDLLTEFEPALMRSFLHEENEKSFFYYLETMVRKLKAPTNESPEKAKRSLAELVATVASWINSNAVYVFRNMDSLLRLKLVDLHNLIFRNYTPTEVQNLIALLRERKLHLDAHLVAQIALLNSLSITDDQFGSSLSDALTIMESASFKHGLVYLTRSSFLFENLKPENYLTIVAGFNELFTSNKNLPRDAALRLLRMRSLQIPGLSQENWFQWELGRLHVVQKGLPESELNAKLIALVEGDSAEDLLDKLVSARYLREKLLPSDLARVSSRIKKGDPISFLSWEKNNAELVKVMSALNPADLGLRSYLIETFTSQRSEGPIGARDSLFLLSDLGRPQENDPDYARVKTRLAQRLRSIQAGDSVRSFRVFLRLFPTEGKEIHEILFRHRSYPKKLVPMMQTLTEETQNNPELLEEIKRAAGTVSAARVHYQGLYLEAWLEKQIQSPKKPSLSCSELAEIPLQ